MLKHLGLFEGIGGFSLAAHWMGWETIAWCEWNPFGQKVLSHYLPNAKGFGDITKSKFNEFNGVVDVLTGGFPCTDISVANANRLGIEGSQSGLVRDMFRAIEETRPKYVVAENVAALLTINNGKDFGYIISRLASMGYNAEWRVIRASDFGAPHHRARLYLVAYPNSLRLQKNESFYSYVGAEVQQRPWHIAGTSSQDWFSRLNELPFAIVDDGVPDLVAPFTVSQWRQESVKAPGNAVVPIIPFAIFKAIEGFENV